MSVVGGGESHTEERFAEFSLMVGRGWEFPSSEIGMGPVQEPPER